MLNFFVKCCKCVKNSINNFHIADVLFFFYIKDFEKLGGKYIREEYLFEAISYKMSKGNVLIHGNQYPVIVREFKGGGARVMDILDEDIEKYPNQNAVMDFYNDGVLRNKNGVIRFVIWRSLIQYFIIFIELINTFCLWKACNSYLQNAIGISVIKAVLPLVTLMVCIVFYRKTHSY